MKPTVSTIPQLYRNLRRLTEILSVLSKYGLADWFSRFSIDFIKDRLKAPDGEILARLTHEARIRLALTELGPTFIKFGQLMSTRPDIVGVPLAQELSKLQSEVRCEPFSQIKTTIEQEQSKSLEELFDSFDVEPIASASIGQVHAAVLPGGRPVVVKVRREGIDKTVATDLDILAGLAQLAERLDEFKPYQPTTVVEEMGQTMRRELRFDRELENIKQFRSLLRNVSHVSVPDPIEELSTKRMLVMERLPGVSVNQLNGSPGLDRKKLAKRGAKLYLKMIFENGLYHADPHPGNILIDTDGTIGLLDFGMVGRISQRMREDIESMLLALVNHDVQLLVMLIRRIGNIPPDLDETALSHSVADFVGRYSHQPLNNFDMTGALTDFISMVRRFQIRLPGEVALLLKVLITLEGTGRLLNPEFSLMDAMKPMHRSMLVRRFSPARQVRKIRRFYLQFEELVESFPLRVSNILEQIQTGKFDVHLDHRRLGPTVNRLVMGLMTSALFLGSSLMLSYEVPPLLFKETTEGVKNISILGMVGCIVSFLMGLRLAWAIYTTGNLDSKEK